MIADALETPSKREQKLARENLEAIEQAVQRHQSGSKPVEIEITGGKTHIKIPVSALRFLNTILEHMAQGKAISIIPSETEVSTQQAAEMLNVSRPHVVKLLESGEIPYRKVGTHRRIKLNAIEHYKQSQDKERRRRLSELAKQAQELDMGY